RSRNAGSPRFYGRASRQHDRARPARRAVSGSGGSRSSREGVNKANRPATRLEPCPESVEAPTSVQGRPFDFTQGRPFDLAKETKNRRFPQHLECCTPLFQK